MQFIHILQSHVLNIALLVLFDQDNTSPVWGQMAGILFEDIFDVKDIDPDGKKFDRGENMKLMFTTLRYTIFLSFFFFYSRYPLLK